MTEEQIRMHEAFERDLAEALARLNDPDDPEDGRRGIIDLSALRRLRTANMHPDAIRLALGSCQYPAGMLDRKPAFAAWKALSAALADAEGPGPDAMVLCGDQIYADATAGLYDPVNADDRFRAPYEAWLRAASVRDVTRRLPMFCLPDDHELVDGWEPIPDVESHREEYKRNRWLRKEGMHSARTYQRPGALKNRFWIECTWKGFSLFMVDSRNLRKNRHALNVDQVPMLGEDQMQALLAWLRNQGNSPDPAFLVAPSLLLPRRRCAVQAGLAGPGSPTSFAPALRSDAMDGFPATWKQILEAMAQSDARRVVLLSGDEHMGLFTTIDLRLGTSPASKTVYSIHSPGLYAPFQFANADLGTLVLDDHIQFPGASTASITVNAKTEVIPGHGFVGVELSQQAGDWWLKADYNLGNPNAAHTRKVKLA